MSKKEKILFIILGLVSFFLVDTFIVKADIVGSEWMYITDSVQKKANFALNETTNYTRQYVLVDNSQDIFFGFSYCGTGSLDFSFPADIEGRTAPIGTYDSGQSCNTDQNGYTGTIYTFYFLVTSWHDAGNGNFSAMYTLRVSNNSYNYTVYITGLKLFVADTIPTAIQYQKDYDGSFNSLQSSLNEVSSMQSTLSNQQKELLEETKQQVAEQEKTNQKLDDVNSSIKETNDILSDDDTSESVNEANSFFSGFTTDTFGLTSIITSPLTLIGSITSSTCSPLSLKVPFLEDNNSLNLPCMSSIYEENFGSFLTIYQTITFGITAYWVCVRIFALVKDFKNPEEDKIEVLDL